MEEILHIAKNITIFVLLFSIVSNLFSNSKYKRYFEFLQGLILILLVVTPLFTKFADGNLLEGLLEKNIFEMEENYQGDELKGIGEQRDRMLAGENKEPLVLYERRGKSE